MQTEYTFAQFLELDTAGKAVLVAAIADINAIDPGNTDAAAIEADIASELDPMPKTTFVEVKARTAWMVTKKAELVTIRKGLASEDVTEAIDGIKADMRKLGVQIGVVAGSLSS